MNSETIDERARKLQEVRRFAADPELLTMLFEFLAGEGVAISHLARAAGPVAKNGSGGGERLTDADIVNRVLIGSEGSESGLWSRKRTS